MEDTDWISPSFPLALDTSRICISGNIADEGGGDLIMDISESGVPVNLEISDLSQVAWLPGRGLRVDGTTVISSLEAPVQMINAFKSTNEISLEAWIRTSEINQTGPARILSISKDNDYRAATIGQNGNAASYDYVARLNTTQADENGYPEVFTTENFITLNLVHLVYTRDYQGNEHIYINGVQKYEGQRGGDFSSLDSDYFVSIANELSGERPWKGTFYMLAIYNKALFSNEVQDNYDAGLGEIRFTSDLPLKPNEVYEIAPFALTDQGIIFGESQEIMLGNVLYNVNEDSLYMAIYPNPGNGDFWIHVDCAVKNASEAYLQVADRMGQIVYQDKITELPSVCQENAFNLPSSEELEQPLDTGIPDQKYSLSGILGEGIYLVMLIVGNESVARRLVVHP